MKSNFKELEGKKREEGNRGSIKVIPESGKGITVTILSDIYKFAFLHVGIKWY